MKYSLLLILLAISLIASAQSYLYAGYGFNQKSPPYQHGKDYRLHNVDFSTKDMLELAYYRPIGSQLNWVFQTQLFSRIFEGTAIKGGQGSGTTLEGRLKSDYLYFGSGLQQGWGNRIQVFIEGGLQVGLRIRTEKQIRTYQYGPPGSFHDEVLTINKLVHPISLRIPLVAGLSYRLPKNIKVQLKYQLAPELFYLGDFIGDVRPLSQSIHLGLVYQLN